jgi:hypothetical protein
MQCAVRGLLVGFDVCELLGVVLRCICRCRRSHLTLVRQRGKLVCNRFCDRLLTIFIVDIITRQCAKCVLVWERWSVPVVACGGGSCVQPALKCLLDHGS